MIIGIIGYSGAGKDTVAKMIQYYFAEKKLKPEFKEKYGLSYTLDEFLSGQDVYNEIHKVNYSYTESISEDSGWQIKKYAAKLKQTCALLVGCRPEDFESEEFKGSDLPKQFWIDGNPSSYRWFLQTVGMKMREVNENIWVDSLMADYKPIETKMFSEYCSPSEVFHLGKVVNEKVVHDGKLYRNPNWIITDVRFENEVKVIKDRKGIILRVDRPSLDLTQDKYKHESENKFQSFEFDNLIINNKDINNLYKKVVYSLEQTIKR